MSFDRVLLAHSLSQTSKAREACFQWRSSGPSPFSAELVSRLLALNQATVSMCESTLLLSYCITHPVCLASLAHTLSLARFPISLWVCLHLEPAFSTLPFYVTIYGYISAFPSSFPYLSPFFFKKCFYYPSKPLSHLFPFYESE